MSGFSSRLDRLAGIQEDRLQATAGSGRRPALTVDADIDRR